MPAKVRSKELKKTPATSKDLSGIPSSRPLASVPQMLWPIPWIRYASQKVAMNSISGGLATRGRRITKTVI